jgi:hypothetical protein
VVRPKTPGISQRLRRLDRAGRQRCRRAQRAEFLETIWLAIASQVGNQRDHQNAESQESRAVFFCMKLP